MDFITNHRRITRGVDSIRVIVDRINKSGHFILIAKNIYVEKLAVIYTRVVVARHKVPVSVGLD